MKKIRIYLASGSPRRKMLLEKMGIKFQVIDQTIEEVPEEGIDPEIYAKNTAIEKAKAAAGEIEEGIIIAADTIVVKDNRILEKPRDKQDAIRMLKMLSGTAHFVYTAVVMLDKKSGRMELELEKTKVEMRKLDYKEIEKYVNSGEPMDAAGAYKIQEGAASFIKRIEGCYYNVVGLPLATLIEMLKKFGIRS